MTMMMMFAVFIIGMECADEKAVIEKCKADCIPYCIDQLGQDAEKSNYVCEVYCAGRKDIFSLDMDQQPLFHV